MSQQFIVLGMTGQAALDVLNENFTELYNNLPNTYKLPGISVNTQQAIAADTMIKSISLSGTAGSPTVRIGTTPNGQDILPDTPIGNSQAITVQLYFQNAGVIYFTLSGGTVSIRIDYQPNFYD